MVSLDEPTGFRDYGKHRRVAADPASNRYELATELNATRVPSLIPLAHESVLPFLSMPPHILRSRAYEKVGTLGMMGFRFHPEAEEGARVTEEGLDWVSSGRYHSS
jgi:hypothetical protein